MEIARGILIIVVVIGSTAILLCSAIGLFLLLKRPTSLYVTLLHPSVRDVHKNFPYVVWFWCLATLGLMISIGFGAHALLFWVPNSLRYSSGENLLASACGIIGVVCGYEISKIIIDGLESRIFGPTSKIYAGLEYQYLKAFQLDQRGKEMALTSVKALITQELSKLEEDITELSRRSKTYARILRADSTSIIDAYWSFPSVVQRRDLGELQKRVEAALAEHP